MPKKILIQPDVWDKGTEHISDLPGISVDQEDAQTLTNASTLVSALPQQKALERIGMPAAVYEMTGKQIVGTEEFPAQIIVSPSGSTWTAVHEGGSLFIFHVVELDGEKRVLCLGLDEALLHGLIPSSSRLTTAEFRVLAGVVDGLTVREVATADNVSYNTRRRQIESVLEKLNVHSQSAAVRLIFVTLIDRILSAISASESDGPGIQTLAKSYGNRVRFHWIHLSDCPPFRVAEFGDPSGRPVLLFHSIGYICDVAPSAMQQIHDAGFRVFVPFRPGFFDAPVWPSRTKPKEALATWSSHCDALLSFLNLEKVDVASVSVPTCWAVDFARRYSGRVNNLIIISAPQPSKFWHSTANTVSFIYSISGIVNRAPWLAEPLSRLHALKHRNHAAALKGLRRAFFDSPADLAEIEKLEQYPNGVDVFRTTLQESIAGIATDLHVLSEPWDTYLAGIDANIHFVHGGADTWCPVDVIERLANSLPQAKLHVMNDRGNLFAMHGFADALRAVNDP